MLQYGTRALLMQAAIGAVAAMCAVSSGMSLGFSAVVVDLQEPPDNLSDEQYSWFTSVAAVVTPLGCLAAGPLLDAVGRKPTLLILNAPFLLGWILLAAAPVAATAQMYAGRAFTGFATGMASVPATVYLGEMAQPGLRGLFVTWTSIAISLGILLAYGVGAAVRPHWRWAAWACAGVPALALPLLALVLPESPVWLAQKGRSDAAEASLRRLRGAPPAPALPPPALAQEIAALPAAPAGPTTPTAARSGCSALRATAAECARPDVWKPLLIMNGFFLFQQITGIYVVVSYAVDIVDEAGVSVQPYLATVLLGCVQLAGGVAVAGLLTRCRRRPLNAWASTAQTVAMAALAVYLHAGSGGASWFPLLALLAYVIAGAFGLHTLPWAMLGEVFPARVRGLAAGLTTTAAYLYNFAMLKTYPALRNACKRASSAGTSEFLFYGFALTSALSVVFVLLWLPETHGRTSQEISEAFGYSPAVGPAPAPPEDPAMDVPHITINGDKVQEKANE